MDKKIVLALLMIAFTLTSLLCIQSVKGASRTLVVPDIYHSITAAITEASDGDVIQVKSGVYSESVTIDKSISLVGENLPTLNANSFGPSIKVNHDGVFINGFSIRNTARTQVLFGSSQGVPPIWYPDIEIIGAKNCIIQGNILADSSRGISLENALQNTITENKFLSNAASIYLVNSSNNRIMYNDISSGKDSTNSGIVLSHSNGNYFEGNNVNDGVRGISLSCSSENIFRKNSLNTLGQNFGIGGESVADFTNDIDESNTERARPIIYWVGRSNQSLPQNAICIILVNCTNMALENLQFSSNFQGITLVNTNYTRIVNNKVESATTANGAGMATKDIWLLFSSYDSIIGNSANIYLSYSSDNLISNNTGLIHLVSSNWNKITENNVTALSFILGDYSGVHLTDCSYNLISNNTITERNRGVWLEGTSSSNLIFQNFIAKNSFGIFLAGGIQAQNNIIFGNNITANAASGISDSAFGTVILKNSIMNQSGGVGIKLTDCNDTIVKGNMIEALVLGHQAMNCTIIDNTILFANTKYPQYQSEFTSIYYGKFERNYWDGFGEDNPQIISYEPVIQQDQYPRMKPIDFDEIQEALPAWAVSMIDSSGVEQPKGLLKEQPNPSYSIILTLVLALILVIAVLIYFKRFRRSRFQQDFVNNS